MSIRLPSEVLEFGSGGPFFREADYWGVAEFESAAASAFFASIRISSNSASASSTNSSISASVIRCAEITRYQKPAPGRSAHSARGQTYVQFGEALDAPILLLILDVKPVAKPHQLLEMIVKIGICEIEKVVPPGAGSSICPGRQGHRAVHVFSRRAGDWLVSIAPSGAAIAIHHTRYLLA
jgi:hypothetical protein